MKDGPYSPYKAAAREHRHRIDALTEGRQPAPAQVHLVLTNRCNHSCTFCSYRRSFSLCTELFDPGSEIPAERGKELIQELARAGTAAVQFTGGGEPTIHPAFQELYEGALRRDMEVALVTNGGRLHKVSTDLLLKSSWIRISLDAATAGTHRKTHGAVTFDRICGSVSDLMQRRTQGGPVVGIGFVVAPDNCHEVGASIALAEQLGVDNIRISAAFYPGAEELHKGYEKDVIRQVQEAGGAKVTVFDLFSDRLSDLRQGSPSYSFCSMARLIPYIGADRQVYSCCILAYTSRGRMGSLEGRSFEQFWYEDAPLHMRDHDATTCPPCMFNEKNEFIRYLIGDQEHARFL